MTPADVIIVGTALNSRGYFALNTIAGLGLNSLGFLWPCDGIWQPSDSPITTTWVSASIPVTNSEVCVDDNGGGFA